MAKTYSMDLRKRVVKGVDKGKSPDEVAAEYEVSRAWVYRLLRRRRETGSIESNDKGKTGRPVKYPHVREEVRKLLKKHPDATLEELREKLSVRVSVGTLCNALKAEGLTLKKSRLRV